MVKTGTLWVKTEQSSNEREWDAGESEQVECGCEWVRVTRELGFLSYIWWPTNQCHPFNQRLGLFEPNYVKNVARLKRICSLGGSENLRPSLTYAGLTSESQAKISFINFVKLNFFPVIGPGQNCSGPKFFQWLS
jgi:hypothetical protein